MDHVAIDEANVSHPEKNVEPGKRESCDKRLLFFNQLLESIEEKTLGRN